MPTLTVTHEAPLELIRQHPGLAVDLVRAPAYLANVREAARCPRAILIVVCPDPREADKCRQVIPMGHPGWDLWPIVIDPSHAPDAAGPART